MNGATAKKKSPAAAAPFGGANPVPVVCPRMQFPSSRRGRKASSVTNIVAALESEITTWQRNNTARRDYSGLMGWNARASDITARTSRGDAAEAAEDFHSRGYNRLK